MGWVICPSSGHLTETERGRANEGNTMPVQPEANSYVCSRDACPWPSIASKSWAASPSIGIMRYAIPFHPRPKHQKTNRGRLPVRKDAAVDTKPTLEVHLRHGNFF